MRKFVSLLFLIICFSFAGCVTDSIDDSTPEAEGPFLNTSDGASAESPNTGGDDIDYSGKVTAGEWSDLNNWQYWNDLKNNKEFTEELTQWGFNLNHRLSFTVENKAGLPVIDAKLVLKDGEGANIWSAKTDNKGKAELWITPFETSADLSSNDCSVWINGSRINQTLKTYEEGVNIVEIRSPQTAPNNVEIAFIVDATGSMSDELEFLKDDLKSIIQKVEKSGSNIDISTSSVFYRDEQDEYLVKSSGFTTNIDNTLSFINEQSAAGGGDFPEAVHTALNTALEDLQWSSRARTRLAFLILDAPPHHRDEIKFDIQNSVRLAAQMGIKLIPVTASGINKNTEFLMRHFSMATNSTYVFITNHSGIGNDHIEPSIGEYEVELLNELLIRLIKKYSE